MWMRPKSTRQKSAGGGTLSDKQILTHLYLENLWEAGVDEVAKQQATLQETRDIAGDFLKDHTVLAKEMRAQAGRFNAAAQSRVTGSLFKRRKKGHPSQR